MHDFSSYTPTALKLVEGEKRRSFKTYAGSPLAELLFRDSFGPQGNRTVGPGGAGIGKRPSCQRRNLVRHWIPDDITAMLPILRALRIVSVAAVGGSSVHHPVAVVLRQGKGQARRPGHDNAHMIVGAHIMRSATPFCSRVYATVYSILIPSPFIFSSSLLNSPPLSARKAINCKSDSFSTYYFHVLNKP